MSGFKGRERAWDIRLAGTSFGVLRGKDDAPVWDVQALPAVVQHQASPVEKEQQWNSWHSGFGYSHNLAPHVYHYGENVDARYPRQIILGPLVTNLTLNGTENTTGFFEHNSQLYALAGRYCFLLSSGDAVSVAKDFGTGATASMALNFDGKTVVAFSSNTDMEQFNANGTWTTLTGLKGKFLAKMWMDSAYAIVRALSTTAIDWASQGDTLSTAGNWGSDYTIGDTTGTITGIVSMERSLHIAKTDGLYGFDRGLRSPLEVPCYGASSNNGVNVMADSAGYVWLPTVGGLVRYNPNTEGAVDCSPGRGLPNASPIYGRVTAQAQYRQWHYVALWNGTDSYILAGREREADEPGFGPLVWHGALVKITGKQIGAMHVSGLMREPRLYFGVGPDAAFIRLPSNADNPLSDSRYLYASSGSIYLPADSWGVLGTRWNLMDVILEAEGLNSATAIDVFASLDQGSFQKVTTINTSGRTVVSVPRGGDWRFSWGTLRLDFTNGSNASTPRVRALAGRAVQRPRLRDVIATTVFCSDQAISRMGIQTRLSGVEQIKALKDLQEAGPAELVDYWTGNQRSRDVLVMPIREHVVKQKDVDAVEQAAALTLVVVDPEINTRPPTYVAVFGQAVYGTDEYSGPDRATAVNPSRFGVAEYGSGAYG